ncbi:hypothetical protein [Gracilibacillus alcaliphilus]|uniref:hypothetical protein n=1 Tax=Gracilibacillus alcaliphilus TaxID=1401441 RepID=UPI001EF93DC5|nr:hypothetical protein [Gracilibacillus alcaliphilus]MBM7675301.1 hypothetical protein [Gracilibacillus alcaliphilus]
MLGLLVIVVLAWYPVKFSLASIEETQLMISHSPYGKNEIEVVRVEEIPAPILKINYGNQTITKTKIPHDISVEWIKMIKKQM